MSFGVTAYYARSTRTISGICGEAAAHMQLLPVSLDWLKNHNLTLTKFLTKEKNWPSVKRSSYKVKRVRGSTEDW